MGGKGAEPSSEKVAAVDGIATAIGNSGDLYTSDLLAPSCPLRTSARYQAAGERVSGWSSQSIDSGGAIEGKVVKKRGVCGLLWGNENGTFDLELTLNSLSLSFAPLWKGRSWRKRRRLLTR